MELLEKSERLKPSQTDLALIEKYYFLFCKANKVNPVDFTGSIREGGKVETRKVFVSAMLRIYNPQVYMQSESPVLSVGFIKQISGVLKLNTGYMSRMVREVILMEKVYDDYLEQVNKLITQLEDRA